MHTLKTQNEAMHETNMRTNPHQSEPRATERKWRAKKREREKMMKSD